MTPPLPEPAWTRQDLANPHAMTDKALRVQRMFTAIAPSYDLNNRLHSLWQDQAWRRYAVRMAQVLPTDTVVDIACGTGDLSMAFAAARPARVLGFDFCHAMVQVAMGKKSPAAPVHFFDGDATALPLADRSADVISIAFGIRNVANWGQAIDEFYRVLRPGGRLIILEFSLPRSAILRGLYNFYFRHVMPRTATLLSGDRSGAYRYLPESVNTFISRETLMQRMGEAGFTDLQARALTFGICVCYRGIRHA